MKRQYSKYGNMSWPLFSFLMRCDKREWTKLRTKMEYPAQSRLNLKKRVKL